MIGSENRASRFLARYERLRTSIGEEERVLRLFDRNAPAPLDDLSRFSDSHSLILSYLAPTRHELSEKLFRNYKLFEKMTVALSHAIQRITEKSYRDYLIWHYFYHFTHESIAEVLQFSERQIYRQAAAARTALAKTLLLPPGRKALKAKRFRIVRRTGGLPQSKKAS